MRRNSPSTVRIERLKKAKTILKSRSVINLDDLASACAVSPPAMRKEILADPNFPVLQHGSNGVEFQFSAHKVLNHLITREKAKLDQSLSKFARKNELQQISVPDDLAGSNSLDMLRHLNMTLAIEDARVKQGQRCDAALVVQLFNEQSRRHIHAIMGVSHKIDPTNLLPPDVKNQVELEMRRAASEMKIEDERALVTFRANFERGRN